MEEEETRENKERRSRERGEEGRVRGKYELLVSFQTHLRPTKKEKTTSFPSEIFPNSLQNSNIIPHPPTA